MLAVERRQAIFSILLRRYEFELARLRYVWVISTDRQEAPETESLAG